MTEPQWLEWAKRLQAAAQNGLAYNHDPFNTERYQAIRAIASDIMAAHTDLTAGVVADLFAAQTGHATPKVDVRGVVIREDAILLVKERSDGAWSLPGGWADVYDSPSEATVREVWEESGYHTRVTKLLALYDRNKQGHPPHPFHTYKIFFRCEIIGGEAAASHETEEVGFFEEDAIPPLSLTRVTPAQIARFFEHARNPDLPTDFD